METWRAAVPRSRWWTDANTVSRLRRSVALQGIGQQWEPAVATLIAGDLEAAVPRSRRWTDAKTVSRLRRSVALQGIGQQWEPAVATLIDRDLEVCGPSQPPVDRWQHRF